jgi:hypothetical protein
LAAQGRVAEAEQLATAGFALSAADLLPELQSAFSQTANLTDLFHRAYTESGIEHHP